jgi:hypothetical protein
MDKSIFVLIIKSCNLWTKNNIIKLIKYWNFAKTGEERD